jgi:hypothetical protein
LAKGHEGERDDERKEGVDGAQALQQLRTDQQDGDPKTNDVEVWHKQRELDRDRA